MYRVMVMFPTSASTEVDGLMTGIASSLRASGSQLVTRSTGSLMGPGAQAGEAGSILESDFASLEDALTALDAEHFAEVKTATEALTSSIFLFEVIEV